MKKSPLQQFNPTHSRTVVLTQHHPNNKKHRCFVISEMQEENGGGVGNDRSYSHFWWAGASATQLGWAVVSYRRGCNQSTLMPFKAFAVASLYVGAAASASVAALRASGVHKVEDLIELGANIRTGLGIQRKARDE